VVRAASSTLMRSARVVRASTRSLARALGLSVLGLVVTVLMVLQPAPWAALPAANAHATTVSTSPAHGSELESAPSEVVITFDEPVTLTGLADPTSVLDADGDRVDAAIGELDASRTTLTIPVQSGLPDGVYIASWRVVSADTHPVGGSLQFGVGVPAGMTQLAEAPEPSAELTLVIGVAKGAVYLALVFALGIVPAALVLGAGPRGRILVRRIAVAGALAAIAASVAQLAAQFFWLRSGGGEGEVVAELGEFLATPYALAVWMRCVALALAAVTIGAGVLGLVAVASVVVNGHGGTNGLLFAATLLHALGAIAWIGGLVVLGWLLLWRRLTAARLARIPVWSIYAAVCAAAVVASGVVQGVSAVGTVEALFTTTYGVLLLVKLGLVAIVLWLGLLGYRWGVRERRLAAGAEPRPGQTARLRRRVRREAGIAAAIVMISGVLSSVTPALDEWHPVATMTAIAGPYELAIEVAPARLGPQTFRISVTPPEPNSPQPEVVDASLQQVDGPVAALDVAFPIRLPEPLDPDSPTTTTFISSAVNVPDTGEWEVVVVLEVDRLEQYSTSFRYDVR
jgi:copper transport protein